MNGGLFFGGSSAALTIAAVVLWARSIRRVDLGERRFTVNAMLACAVAIAIVAFLQEPGVAGGILAGSALAFGALYFGLLALAGQSTQPPAVAVGDALPDFRAPDHDGRSFELSSLRGHPILLKFFRGHW